MGTCKLLWPPARFRVKTRMAIVKRHKWQCQGWMKLINRTSYPWAKRIHSRKFWNTNHGQSHKTKETERRERRIPRSGSLYFIVYLLANHGFKLCFLLLKYSLTEANCWDVMLVHVENWFFSAFCIVKDIRDFWWQFYHIKDFWWQFYHWSLSIYPPLFSLKI